MSYPAKNLKIWECPTGEQVTAHCLLSNRKEKLFKFSISWTDVFATSKQMATHQWINFWSFWGQLILTPSDHHWMLKIFLHPNGFEKKHAKILNYINSLLDYWSLKCFGISGTIFQPPECTFSVDLEGCHFGEVHGPAIREVQRFNWTPWLHGKRYNTEWKPTKKYEEKILVNHSSGINRLDPSRWHLQSAPWGRKVQVNHLPLSTRIGLHVSYNTHLLKIWHKCISTYQHKTCWKYSSRFRDDVNVPGPFKGVLHFKGCFMIPILSHEQALVGN